MLALIATLAVVACGSPSEPATSHPRLGTFLWSPVGPAGPDQAAFQSARDQFDLYILPVYLQFVEPAEGQFDFSMADAVADAAPSGTTLYVNDLISNDLLPDWLKNAGYSGEQLRAILVAYVTTVVEHFETKYPGRVFAYEVVLEPLSWQGPAGFWHRIGLDAGLDQYEYLRLAFRTARAAAPEGKLYIDELGAEDAGERSDALFALVSQMLADDVPIDGVGLEGHFMIGPGSAFPPPPPTDHVAASLGRYAALGLETMLTSVDIAIPDTDDSSETLAAQAAAYGSLVHACRDAGCVGFATWGLGDTDSWILQYFMGWGRPLLFDAHYAPKATYDAVEAALGDQ